MCSFHSLAMDPQQHLSILNGQKNFFEKRFERAKRQFFWKTFEVRIQEYVKDIAEAEGLEKLTKEKPAGHVYKREGREILGYLFDLVKRIP